MRGVGSQDVEQLHVMYVNILKYTGSYTLLKVLRINESYLYKTYVYARHVRISMLFSKVLLKWRSFKITSLAVPIPWPCDL